MGALVRGRDGESGEPTISLESQVEKTKAGRGEPRRWMGPAERGEGWAGDLEKGREDDRERV